MSGEAFQEYNLYQFEYMANTIKERNPVFAEFVSDVGKLLDRYNYLISGDIGEDTWCEVWSAFSVKWMKFDSDPNAIKKIMMEDCSRRIDLALGIAHDKHAGGFNEYEL